MREKNIEIKGIVKEENMGKENNDIKDADTKLYVKNRGIRIYNIVIGIIAALALGISLANIDIDNKPKKESADNGIMESSKEDICYRIYIGLTDKETNYQKIDITTAIEIVKNICISRKLGYTIYEAHGGYRDSNSVLHTERTIVLEMDHITDDELHLVLADVSKRLNTNALMYTREDLEVVYYNNNN